MLPFNLIRKDRWPLYAAILVLLIFTVLLGLHALDSTDGIFSLPNDEAYLQLTMARSLAFRQVWGIGHHDFVSIYPSLLYPLGLAAVFLIFGAHLVLAPIANFVLATILLTKMQHWLAKKLVSPPTQLFIMLAVIILSPLPVMIIYGLEATLLLLMAFLFISRLVDEWQLPEFSRRTLVFGALMVAARYDGAWLIGVVCLLLLWRRQWLGAFELVIWCLLPALAFGFLSLYKGSFFLPNTFITGSATFLLSYDWLVGCGIAVTIPLLQGYFARLPQKKGRFIPALPAVFIALVLLTTNLYAVQALDQSRLATYKMNDAVARFARLYYYKYGITSDDIGMISFFTDANYVDLSGVASTRIARIKTSRYFNTGLIRRLSDDAGVKLAVISSQYDKGLPDNWVRMASWNIAGREAWTFYCTDTFSISYFKWNMNDYARTLYPDIKVNYFYTQGPEKKTP